MYIYIYYKYFLYFLAPHENHEHPNSHRGFYAFLYDYGFRWQDFKVLASFFLGVVCCKTSDLGRWVTGWVLFGEPRVDGLRCYR